MSDRKCHFIHFFPMYFFNTSGLQTCLNLIFYIMQANLRCSFAAFLLVHYLELLKGIFFFQLCFCFSSERTFIKAILRLLVFFLDFFGTPVKAQKRPERDKNKRPISIKKKILIRSPGNTIFSPPSCSSA